MHNNIYLASTRRVSKRLQEHKFKLQLSEKEIYKPFPFKRKQKKEAAKQRSNTSFCWDVSEDA